MKIKDLNFNSLGEYSVITTDHKDCVVTVTFEKRSSRSYYVFAIVGGCEMPCANYRISANDDVSTIISNIVD